jgi:predicted RND superfamily exporter protein
MSTEPPEGTGLALGIEKIGLLSLRFPVAVAIVAVLVVVLAAFGVARLRVDDSLSQLFRSDTDEFRQYEEVSRRFPSAEFDILVVVEGDVLGRDSLQGLRDLVTDLQLVDGTRGLISLFSARQPPAYSGGLPEPLFPEDLPPDGPGYDAFVAKVMDNEIIKGKLLSLDGTLALVVLALDPEIVGGRGLSTVVSEIRGTVDLDLAGTGVTGRLSGVPVMQLEIRNAVERDRLIYNAIGFIAGCVIAGLFFRRVSFIVIAAGPPLVAILWSLGALGWFDFRLNMFLNVMTPLIMVMGFSDSMQVTFAARDRLLAGDSKYEAFKWALLVVGPAVVVTDLTAALSFIALMFSKSELIRTFGYAGAVSCVVAFLAVIILVPLLGVLLVRNEKTFAARVRDADTSVDVLRTVCTWIANVMVKRPGLYSLIALLVVGGLVFMFANLEPRYRLADQVPDKEQAVAASGSIDAKLAGANPIDVLVELPSGKNIFEPDALDAIGAIHTAVESEKGVANVWSVETLRRWLIERMGRTDPQAVEEYVHLLPRDIVGRFVSDEEDAVVISGRIPDIDASELLPVVEALDKSLDTVRAEHPDYNIAVTGLSAIAARNSALMIDQLAESLTWEMIAVAALIGIAFRSLLVMTVAILPGLFPIVVAGAILWYLDAGLQFASIVALTVAFGLGLDATIHFLNRLRLEDRPDEDPAEGVKRATVLVGPALILTSLVLACGLAVTVFSDLPSLQLFGWLSAFTLIAALVGDLLILPATVTFLRRMIRTMRGNRPASPAPRPPS